MEGLTVPLPYAARGVLDTGAEQTCLSNSIVSTLSLRPVMHTALQGVLGEERVAIYQVTLLLGWREDRPPDPISLHAPAIREVLGGEILIGLDVLRLGEFVLYGPDSRYELMLPAAVRPEAGAAERGCGS